MWLYANLFGINIVRVSSQTGRETLLYSIYFYPGKIARDIYTPYNQQVQ